MMAAWDLDRTWAQLPTLALPLLLIVGSNDRTVPPSQSDTVARRALDVIVERLPDLGHLAHEEAPETVATRVLAFADRVGQSPANRS